MGAGLCKEEKVEYEPIEYVSRAMTAVDLNYSLDEKDGMAAMWAVRRFSAYREQTDVVTADGRPRKVRSATVTPPDTGRGAKEAPAPASTPQESPTEEPRQGKVRAQFNRTAARDH